MGLWERDWLCGQRDRFVAPIERSDRASPLDPRALPVLILLGLAMLIEALVLQLSDFHLGQSNIMRSSLFAVGLLILASLVRRRHFERLALLLDALAVPALAAWLGVTATVFLAAISAPFADRMLDDWDKALGFDFLALLDFYRANPGIATLSRYAYLSFSLQAALCASLLALSGQGQRMWIFLTCWVFTLALTVLIFPFFPAAGPYALHGVQEDVFENFKQLFPWQTGPAIEALRDGTMRDVGAAARGFVSMPSFHAAGGLMFAWAAFNSRRWRWPVLLLNLALIASTIVTGAHYLVDIIAGLALAGLVLVASCWLIVRIETTRRCARDSDPAPC